MKAITSFDDENKKVVVICIASDNTVKEVLRKYVKARLIQIAGIREDEAEKAISAGKGEFIRYDKNDGKASLYMYDGCWETVQIIDISGPVKNAFPENSAKDIIANKDEYGYVKGYVRVNEKNMPKFSEDEDFLNMLGKKLVGGNGMDYVEYTVVGIENEDTFVLHVLGELL